MRRFLSSCLRRIDGWLLGLAGLTVFLMAQVLHTGFLGDDVGGSLVRGIVRFHDTSLASLIQNHILAAMAWGRFLPLTSVQIFSTFYLFPDVIAYKCLLIGYVVLSVLLFSYFVRRLTGQAAFAALAGLASVVCFQLRVFHDPFLAYNGLVQGVFLDVVLSLIFLLNYLESRRRGWLLLATLAYLVGLLTYEITYPLIVLHLLVILSRERKVKRVCRLLTPFAVVLLLCMATSLSLRLRPGVPTPEGYRPNTDPVPFLVTLYRQTIAALPLSYNLADRPSGFGWRGWRDLTLPTVGAFAGSFLLALLFLRALQRGTAARRSLNYRLLVPLGVALWILPGVLVSLSPIYQQIIGLGLAYLPVFLEYFGVGLLLACGLTALCSLSAGGRVRAWATALGLALVIGLTASFTYATNQKVVRFYAVPHYWQRLNVEAALHAGLLEEVPEHATLCFAHEYPWWHGIYSPYFYAEHAGKRFNTVWKLYPELPWSSLEAGVFARTRCADRAEVYEIADDCVDEHRGWVMLAQLEPTTAPSSGSSDSKDTRKVRIFVHDDSDQGVFRDRFWVTGRYRQADGEGERFFFNAAQLHVVRQGHGWAICDLDEPKQAIALDSLEGFLPRGVLGGKVGAGFHYEENPGGASGHWCGKRGELYLVNGTGRTLWARVDLSLSAPGATTVVVDSELFRETLSLSGTKPVRFSRMVRLEPGAYDINLRATPVEGGSEKCCCRVAGFEVAEVRASVP